MAKRITSIEKVLIVLCALYLFGTFVIRCWCPGDSSQVQNPQVSGTGIIPSTKQQHLDDFRKLRAPNSEIYVISMHESKFNVFEQRNFDMVANNDEEDEPQNGSGSPASMEWFRAYNGMNQTVLDEFSSLTGIPKINASEFVGMSEQAFKAHSNSPHAVGCYLSHWQLLQSALSRWNQNRRAQNEKQKQKRRPDMLFVFEDDAHCVTNLVARTWQVVKQLPPDWDVLYIGGKPMSYYTKGKHMLELADSNGSVSGTKNPPTKKILQQMCNGRYGPSYSGPFAPGTSEKDSFAVATGANLAEDPPYWRVKHMFNTNSYVINPKRIRRVLRVLAEPMSEFKPVDIRLADDQWREFMRYWTVGQNISEANAPLKAYLTPKLYCDQEVQRRIFDREEPQVWQGYHYIPWRKFKSFPAMECHFWGDLADRNMCSNIKKEMQRMITNKGVVTNFTTNDKKKTVAKNVTFADLSNYLASVAKNGNRSSELLKK